MLLHRVITALILLPLVIYGVLNLSTPVFSIILAGVILLGAREWWALAGIKSYGQRGLFISAVLASLFLTNQLLALPAHCPV